MSGACATPEFLMYMNYFVGLEYGRDYFQESDKVVDLSKKSRTIDKVITDCFEQIVYTINQPTGRGIFRRFFGTYLITTNIISRACSVISTFPMALNLIGSR